MERRNFLKACGAAVAGLFAADVKRHEADPVHVRFDRAETVSRIRSFPAAERITAGQLVGPASDTNRTVRPIRKSDSQPPLGIAMGNAKRGAVVAVHIHGPIRLRL